MEGNGIDVQAIMETVGALVSTWGLRVVGALAVLIIGWIVAKGVRRSLSAAHTDIFNPSAPSRLAPTYSPGGHTD